MLSYAAQVETGAFLDQMPAVEIAAPQPSTTEIGPYRLIRKLGIGGMATVWLAERSDRLIDRPVALKLPHPSLASVFADRVARERDLLAKLDHPNIARLYDAGVTGDGQPFLALEYVDGTPIDKYCQQQNMTVNARVRMFASVIDAVAHAHAKLIVHRDIKPNNVLVNDRSEVRLLDFGIAKLIGDDNVVAETELTRIGGRAMTLAYASPEQLRGDLLTVAADVFSLGVLLYELLCGKRPHWELSGVALEHAVQNDDPIHPSAATENPADAGEIVGDLDVIVMKALAKEPERRYSTCHAMGEDLRRFLANEPVVARPTSLRYRVGKFAARHKAGIGAALTVAMALVIVAVISLYAAIGSARSARQLAEERDKAEQISDFLTGIFELSSPNRTQGQTVTALELLNRGTERIRNEITTQPLRQASLMDTIARVYAEMNQFDAARELLFESRQLRRDHGDSESAEYADSSELLATLVEVDGALDDAETLFQEALRIRQDVGDDKKTASSLLLVGRVRHKKGQVDAAESLYRQALALRRSVDQEDDEMLANALGYIGSILQQRGEIAEAESLQLEALAIRRRLYTDDHLSFMESHYNLGVVYTEKGELETAIEHFQEGLRIAEKLVDKEDHGKAFFFAGLGNLHERLNDLGKAESAYEQAMLAFAAGVGRDHWNTGIAQGNLGRVLVKLERFEQAESLLRQGISSLRSGVPAHRYLPRMEAYLGRSLLALGRPDDAIPLLEQALAALEEANGPDHLYTQEARDFLAEAERSETL